MKDKIKSAFRIILEERIELIKKLEKLCPPCTFTIVGEEGIEIKNSPTTSGKTMDFYVDLKKMEETPEEWLKKEVAAQEEKRTDKTNLYEGKSNAVKKILDSTAQAVFGMSVKEALEKGVCVKCKQEVGEFKDPSSEKEYRLSALCQSCQDEFFGSKSELEFESSQSIKKGEF